MIEPQEMTDTQDRLSTRVDFILALMPEMESGHPDRAVRYLSDDFIYTDTFPEPLNRDQYLEFQRLLKQAFPDWSHHLRDFEAEGEDIVHAILERGGTHTGELVLPGLQPIPPTGVTVQLPPEPVIFSFFEDIIDKIQVEEIPGGGLEGLLSHLGVEMPWTYSGLWTRRLIKPPAAIL
ncbi:MAG: hypothetical protein C4524_07820 [Candidatus Zixiibacteriota bacterium]|nr:MAG: hypothetical protein C4524_07820 [candidate division Zixibacteria bacterium]